MNNKSLKILSHEKSNKGLKNKTIKKIFFIGISLVTAYVMASCGVKEKAPEATPTVEVTYTATPEPTPEPTAEPTAEPTPEPTPVKLSGEDFLNELAEKGYKYLLDGDIITFNRDKVENLFDLFELGNYEGSADLRDDKKREAILDYQQAILFYCGDSLDPTTGGPIDFSNYRGFSVQEGELLNNISSLSRNIAVLSTENPINGKMYEGEIQTGEYKNEYLIAANKFIEEQANMLEGNPSYDGAQPWVQYLASSLVIDANHAYLPSYFYKIDSKTGKKVYMVSFKTEINDNLIEEYIPIRTEKGTRYKRNTDGKEFTYDEMISSMDPASKTYVPGLVIEGISTYAFNVRKKAEYSINSIFGTTIEKNDYIVPETNVPDEVTANRSVVNSLSNEVISFISDTDPDGYYDLTNEEKATVLSNSFIEIENYSKSISDPLNVDTIDFGVQSYLYAEEVELSKNVYDSIRNLALLSKNQQKDSEEYLSTVKSFMLEQMAIRNGNDTYKKADAWYRYVISSMINEANNLYVPEYLYAEKESDPEVRDADYYGVYFLDMENQEGYYPEKTDKGVVYTGEIYRRSYTLKQMEEFTNKDSKKYNPNIKKRGVKTEAIEEQEKVFDEIEMQQGIKVGKVKIIG